MVATPSPEPIASRGYLALVLDMAFSGMVRLVGLTALFEGAGRFTALNRNADKAGLSFGLIEWAQKPGRLNELLRAFHDAQPDVFVQILGDGDAALAAGLLAHTAKPRAELDPVEHDGPDVRPDGGELESLARPPAATRDLQKVQIRRLSAPLRPPAAQIRAYAPSLRSERSLAFMLRQIANQHGDDGARKIFVAANWRRLSEAEHPGGGGERVGGQAQDQFGAASNRSGVDAKPSRGLPHQRSSSDEPVNA